MSEIAQDAGNPVNLPATESTEPDEKDLSRRGFFKLAVGGMACVYAAAIIYPVYRYLNSPVEESIAEAAIKAVDLTLDQIPPVGKSTMFFFGPHPAMLTHFEDGTLVALTAVCTHLGCTLHYDPPAPRIVCPCHGGQYDPHTGQNLAGPPPAPLTKYIVTKTKTGLTISRP